MDTGFVLVVFDSTLTSLTLKITTASMVILSVCRITATSAPVSAPTPVPNALAENKAPPESFEAAPNTRHASDLESQSITNYQSDGVVSSASTTMSCSRPEYLRAMSTKHTTTLKDFLQRPIILGSLAWTSMSTAGTILASFELPDALLASPQVTRKLDGFMGIRGTIRFRVQATSTPMHAGRLRIVFYPQAWSDPTYLPRLTNMTCLSTMPGVDLDLNVATVAEFDIPYVTPFSFYDLTQPENLYNDNGYYGPVSIVVYSPLSTGSSSTTVPIQIYAHFMPDLELINPGPNRFESGTSPINGTRSLSTETSSQGGAISKVLSSTAKVASALTAIPMVSDLAGPVAWASRIGAGLASAFGYSRVPDTEKACRMAGFDYPYSINVEGVDCALPLAMTVDPRLREEPCLNTNGIDEMSYNTFATKLGYVQRFSVSTSVAAGDLLVSLPCDTSGAAGALLPFSALAAVHQSWRADVVFKFKFVKTKFHAGRLIFAFVPGEVAPTGVDATSYCHREIIEISDTTELTFVCPYTSNVPYCDSGARFGTLAVYAAGPIIATTTVANSFDVIVEKALGPGAEFVGFVGNVNFYAPVIELNEAPRVTRAESGNNPIRTMPMRFGGSTPSGEQLETSQLCVGERVMSLRQLIKRPMSTFGGSRYIELSGTTINQAAYDPYILGGIIPTAPTPITGDMVDLFAGFFRYNRGGMRARCIYSVDEAIAETPWLEFYPVTTNQTEKITETFSPEPHSGDLNNRNVNMYLLPPWHRTPMNYNLWADGVTPEVTPPSEATYHTMLGFRSLSPTSQTLRFMFSRQPADDFTFLYYVGAFLLHQEDPGKKAGPAPSKVRAGSHDPKFKRPQPSVLRDRHLGVPRG